MTFKHFTAILSHAVPLAFIVSLSLTAQSTAQDNDESSEASLSTHYYEIDTRLGRMVVRLYDDTPKHSENFAKLASEGFFNGTTFHRVINGFMIQGGDPNSKNDDPMDDGQGGPGYTIPAETNPEHFHKKGALAGARQADQVNPMRASNGSQFYIVLGGREFTPDILKQVEPRLRQQIPDPDFSYSPEQVEAYSTVGGAPHLDGMYTVFGEVVEGFDVLDAIGAVETPRSMGEQTNPTLYDQPTEPIEMTVRPLDDDYTPPPPPDPTDEQ